MERLVRGRGNCHSNGDSAVFFSSYYLVFFLITNSKCPLIQIHTMCSIKWPKHQIEVPSMILERQRVADLLTKDYRFCCQYIFQKFQMSQVKLDYLTSSYCCIIYYTFRSVVLIFKIVRSMQQRAIQAPAECYIFSVARDDDSVQKHLEVSLIRHGTAETSPITIAQSHP